MLRPLSKANSPAGVTPRPATWCATPFASWKSVKVVSTPIEASVARGLADIAAGSVYEIDEVFDQIEAGIERAPTASDQ